MREYKEDLLIVQKEIRLQLLSFATNFDFSSIKAVLEKEKEFLEKIERLQNESNNHPEEHFFRTYRYLLASIFHLLKFAQKELNGEISNHLKAAKTNINLIDLETISYIEEFKENIINLRLNILNVEDINDVKNIINIFSKIQIPFISDFPKQKTFLYEEEYKEAQIPNKELINVLSFNLFIDDEPWPNPKILKPNVSYKISGKVNLNFWPENYDKLIIKPLSTTDNDWYVFSVPFIQFKKNEIEYVIEGNVIFKYPQNSIDDNICIKLFAYFENDSNKKYPTLIGYDQLILKVFDFNSHQINTGFKMMDKAAHEILEKINEDLYIDKEEKSNFIKLLQGVLNYQGFSIQHGIFKNVDSMKEDVFRDKLIQHLIGLQYLGENITKEGHLSGGRVEISYNGIIAELKVENNISDRKKMIEKYQNQPVAYSSGNSKQLSILCILDLTEKLNPPASPINNISFVSPKLHGFQSEDIGYKSGVAVVIIDGNTKKPSDYSK
ncbi:MULTISPECIES: hypothetical protein [unclassified Arcicella]|uniref:hypothetical protein n=1 Tax=unclassified Arcicella TaxID=2644986 RepID=UPI00285C18F3|nr:MULTISPECIES: hypothetical protein [unclassified Arcicella]MDR6564191.1 hypothetical protein [Arcicella sp. BE51]MDR6811563.1 hypothetical protein [Arcicella sp. BE140]MDR6823089.1 hypothetical protein [Arcicella sp. BE139]